MDIYVFRNQNLFPEWLPLQKYRGEDLGIGKMRKRLWGQQQEARFACIKEFVMFLKKKIKREELKSDFLSHKEGVFLLSAAYQSGVKWLKGQNPLVKITF